MTEVKKRVSRLKERIFSDEIINGGRQPKLDLAKAVVIVCLALVHCTIECTDEEGLLSGLPYLFDSPLEIFSGLCGLFAAIYFVVGIHFEPGMFGEGQIRGNSRPGFIDKKNQKNYNRMNCFLRILSF